MDTVLFVNWTNEEFVGMWGKEPHPISAGQKVYYPRYLADHFAKHLADRELNKDKLPTDHHTRPQYIAKCFGEVHKSEGNSAVMTEVEILNRNAELTSEVAKPKPFCDQCDSRGGRHKQNCPTLGFTASEDPKSL